MLTDYWYCSCAADSPPAPVFSVPAAWPPEPEEPSGTWEVAEGSSTLGSGAGGSEACRSGAADAEADTDAGGADAGADAEAGLPRPVPFPQPASPEIGRAH